jgi:hypothetical protein
MVISLVRRRMGRESQPQWRYIAGVRSERHETFDSGPKVTPVRFSEINQRRLATAVSMARFGIGTATG